MKYKMKLHDEPFNQIKKGTKIIELRLNDEKRRLLNINDLIGFTNIETSETILVKVQKIYKYNSFEDLYKHFDKIALGYDVDEVASYKDMEKYYSKEEQEKYGVVGIQISRL